MWNIVSTCLDDAQVVAYPTPFLGHRVVDSAAVGQFEVKIIDR